MSNIEKMDKFWLDNFSVLYEDYNFLKFIPTPNMTKIEQLNAITRLMLYTIIIMLTCGQNEELLYIPIAVIVLTVLVYNICVNNNNKNVKYNVNEGLINIERDAYSEKDSARLQIDSMENIVATPNPKTGRVNPNTIDNGHSRNVLTKDGKIVGLEAGIIDSEGDIITGRRLGPYTNEEITDCQRSNYENCASVGGSSFGDSFGNFINESNCCNTPQKPNNSMPNCCDNNDDDVSLCNKEVGDNSFQCREPTLENPFMNPNITEYNTDFSPPAACNAEDEDIKDNIKVNFDHNLFRDVDEVWERENSQRQFYTLPNTGIPDNRDGFQRWLWGDYPSGKEGTTGANSIYVPYSENLKYKR